MGQFSNWGKTFVLFFILDQNRNRWTSCFIANVWLTLIEKIAFFFLCSLRGLLKRKKKANKTSSVCLFNKIVLTLSFAEDCLHNW